MLRAIASAVDMLLLPPLPLPLLLPDLLVVVVVTVVAGLDDLDWEAAFLALALAAFFPFFAILIGTVLLRSTVSAAAFAAAAATLDWNPK